MRHFRSNCQQISKLKKSQMTEYIDIALSDLAIGSNWSVDDRKETTHSQSKSFVAKKHMASSACYCNIYLYIKCDPIKKTNKKKKTNKQTDPNFSWILTIFSLRCRKNLSIVKQDPFSKSHKNWNYVLQIILAWEKSKVRRWFSQRAKCRVVAGGRIFKNFQFLNFLEKLTPDGLKTPCGSTNTPGKWSK